MMRTLEAAIFFMAKGQERGGGREKAVITRRCQQGGAGRRDETCEEVSSPSCPRT